MRSELPSDNDLRRHKRRRPLRYFVPLTQALVGAGIGASGNYISERAISHSAALYAFLAFYSPSAAVLSAIIPVLAVGAGLFWARGRYPVVYGTTEAAFGILAAINGLGRIEFAAPSSSALIQVVAGLYIIVRGLDNIGVGIAGSAFEPAWRRIFPKARDEHLADVATVEEAPLKPYGRRENWAGSRSGASRRRASGF